MKAEGFYDKAPYKGREVAIASLTASEPTDITRGIRLGNFTQIRAEFGTQMQAIFANKVSVQEGLDTLVKNGDADPRPLPADLPGQDPALIPDSGRAVRRQPTGGHFVGSHLRSEVAAYGIGGPMEKRVTFSKWTIGILFAVPQLLLIFTFFYWPAGQAVYWALTLQQPWGGGNIWVGLDNFRSILSNADLLGLDHRQPRLRRHQHRACDGHRARAGAP